MHKITIENYNKSKRSEIEVFRQRTFEEGNDALPLNKYNPDQINGETFMAYVDGVLASISVIEEDHYVTDNPVVVRACRFHTLKKFRNLNLGAAHLLPTMCSYAIEAGYKTIYWTHNVENKALNAVYQKKRRPPNNRKVYESSFWQSIKFDEDWLFQVDPKSDMLQYVYYIGDKITPMKNYVWKNNGNKT